jgi:hypothetical protein
MPHPNGWPTFAEMVARGNAIRAERAARQDWFDRAMAAARSFAERTRSFEGGHIAQACRDAGIEEPVHHNFWVTLVWKLEKDGVIIKGAYVPPTTRHSHIHRLRSWRSNVYRAAE